MNPLRPLLAVLVGCLFVFASAPAAADPDATSQAAASPPAAPAALRAAIAPPSLALPAGGSRPLQRSRSRSWLRLGKTRPTCQPVVGQYSCLRPCEPCWRYVLALPIWIPGISAQAGEGAVSVDGERDPLDAVDGDAIGDVEFAFVGAFFARRGRWGGGVDFLTARIKASASFSIADGALEVGASGKLTAAIAGARVDYLYTRAMLPWKMSACGCAEHRVYAGARVYDVSVTANALNVAALALDVSDTWVDPIIGFDSRVPVGRNWSVQIAGDVGGFDIVGNWSYSLFGGVHWRFARKWGATFGYQMLDLRRKFGGPGDPKKIDLNLRGPQLAIQFFF